MKRALLALALVAASATAQITSPLAYPSLDISTLPSKADVAAAQASADAANAAIPPRCTTVPSMDTTNGAVGVGVPGTTAPDNTRPTTVQIATASGGGSIVTASDGTFSGVWPRAWLSAPSYAHAEIYGTTTPYVCMVTSATINAVVGKCSQLISTTLPGVLTSLFGLVVNPLSTAAAGLTVRVVGRQ